MRQVIAFLSRFVAQPDKLLHFAGGLVVAFALAMAGGQLAALWIVAALAWAKERYDKAHPDRHTWDGWDAFATLLGGLAGVTALAAWLAVQVALQPTMQNPPRVEIRAFTVDNRAMELAWWTSQRYTLHSTHASPRRVGPAPERTPEERAALTRIRRALGLRCP